MRVLKHFFICLLYLGALCFTNCKDHVATPPLPEFASEFTQPEVNTFSYTEPITVEWETHNFPIIETLPKSNFSWDNLPTKPFSLRKSTKIDSLSSKPFSLENLPSRPINYDSWPSKPLDIKLRKLGDPKIVKAGNPLILPQSSRGVVSLAEDFGYDGSIYASYLDKDNFVWLGGTNSIIKYDSENLEIYGIDQNVFVNNVNEIFTDSKGRMWFGGARAVNVIDFEKGVVMEIITGYAQSVAKIIEDNQGRIWFSIQNVGYQIVDLTDKTVRTFSKEQGLSNNFAIRLLQDTNGLIWLGTGDGVNILDFESNTNKWLKLTEDAPTDNIYEFFIDDQDRLWIGGDLGVTIINKARSEITAIDVSNSMSDFKGITSIYQDTDGIFWIGTLYGHLFSYDENINAMEKYDILPGFNILYKIFKNNEGQIWMSAINGGLFVLDSEGYRPGNFTTENGLGDNNIWGTLRAKDDKMYIGTYNGIDVYDPKTQEIKHIGVENGLGHPRNPDLMEDPHGRIWCSGNINGISIIDPNKETITVIKPENLFGIRMISTLFMDSQRLLWVGGADGDILKIDIATGIMKKRVQRPGEPIFRIDSFTELTDNSIWGSTTGRGIFKISKGHDTLQYIDEGTGLNSNIVFALAKDDQDNIWTASINGVEMLNIKSNQITTFTTSEGLAASDVYDLVWHNKKIYAGTSKGFSIIETTSGPKEEPYYYITTIGREQGLSYADIAQSSISFDSQGRLWAGASGQILTIIDDVEADSTAIALHITGFNILDEKQEFKETPENIELFYEDSLMINPEDTKQTVPKSMSELDKDIEWSALSGPYDLPKDLKLSPDQNYLSFNYHGIKFKDHNSLVYRYFLEGIDKNWSGITKETTSENYRDLPPGEYNFEVVAKSAENKWTAPSEFHFTIMPYWYQTWWAYLLFFLIFCSILYATIQYRSQWLKKENKLLEEKVSLRTEQLRNKIEQLKATQSQLIQSEKMASLGELTAGIAHEIQNPLNFVNNFSEINTELIDEMLEEIRAGKQEEVVALSVDIKENQKKISHHGKRADAIVKGMLHHSRSGNNTKEPTDINALADEYLRLAYHGLRAKDKSFNATMMTDFDENIGRLLVVPQDIGRVILNLITNAFYAVNDKKRQLGSSGSEQKYEPTVWVSTKCKADKVLVIVEDNGNGIPKNVLDKIFQPFFTTKPTGEGTGLGLSLSYDIMQAHGGVLSVETKEKEGTKFTIDFPNDQEIKK